MSYARDERRPPNWIVTAPIDLESAIRTFKLVLPGWWYSVCECQVSCDASCAPTVDSEDILRIERAGDQWDNGFHADLPQPSTLAEALMDVMNQALAAKRERASGEKSPDQPQQSLAGQISG